MSELLKKIHLFDGLTGKELEKIKNICIKETHAKDTMMSASAWSDVISNPDPASVPSICSASTWFLGQPRLIIPILCGFFFTDLKILERAGKFEQQRLLR